MELKLPDLETYKSVILESGIKLPLRTTAFKKEGLLKSFKSKENKTGWPWTEETNPNIYSSNKDWPKLSIVIPSYNQGIFIEEAIRSVIFQNYPNLELIVIDGGSNDETKNIMEEYSSVISYWQCKKDKGQGNAINIGFSIASGEYLGWLNSDDFYNKDAFYHLGKAILSSKKDFYYGDAFTTNEDRTEEVYWKASLVLDRYLRFGGLIASHSAFWKKEINVPIWEEMNCNVDGELWIRLVKNKTKGHVKFPLGTIRIQKMAKSHNESWIKKWKEDDLMIESVHGKPPAPKAYITYENRYIQRVYKKF